MRWNDGVAPLKNRFIPALCLVGLLLVMPSVALADQYTVQMRETPLRESPGPFARVLERLSYGSIVVVVERRGGWSRVARPAGWVHDSALTDSEVELLAGDEDAETGVTADEIALAGKGFGPEVEARYREDEGLDFGWVDRMERDFEIADQVKLRFLQEGNLDAR